MTTMHTIPQEWKQQCGVFNAELRHDTFRNNSHASLDNISADLALKGGWKAGYSWSGNYLVTVAFRTYGRMSPRPKYKGYANSLEGARRVLDKAMRSKAATKARRLHLVTLYKDMLKDKRIAKRHKNIMTRKYGKDWMNSDEAITACHVLLGRLLVRRGWTEEIDGWHTPDGRIFDDLHSMQWRVY